MVDQLTGARRQRQRLDASRSFVSAPTRMAGRGFGPRQVSGTRFQRSADLPAVSRDQRKHSRPCSSRGIARRAERLHRAVAPIMDVRYHGALPARLDAPFEYNLPAWAQDGSPHATQRTVLMCLSCFDPVHAQSLQIACVVAAAP